MINDKIPPSSRLVFCVSCIKKLRENSDHRCHTKPKATACDYCSSRKLNCVKTPIQVSRAINSFLFQVKTLYLDGYEYSNEQLAHDRIKTASSLLNTIQDQTIELTALHKHMQLENVHVSEMSRIMGNSFHHFNSFRKLFIEPQIDIEDLLKGLEIIKTDILDISDELEKIEKRYVLYRDHFGSSIDDAIAGNIQHPLLTQDHE